MALETTTVAIIDRQDWLEPVGEGLQRAVSGAFEAGGPVCQSFKNFLHGTWLGHPLHPVLVNIPIGAWTTALVFDVAEMATGRKEFARGAELAVTIGLAGAVGSAVTGLNDWQHTDGRARRVGLTHGLLNAGATLLYTTSLVMRRRKAKRAGQTLAMLGFAVANAAAYLGGHLVFGEQVGVDHTVGQTLSDQFRPALAEAALGEGEMRRAEVDGVRVLLVRHNGRIYAMAETCSHMGGPLAEGRLEDDCVRCPWHGSRFALEDGRVVDGPSTYQQPSFETRINNGQVEVRAAEEDDRLATTGRHD